MPPQPPATEQAPVVDDDQGPHPTVQEVLACQLSAWHPTFSNLATSSSSLSSSPPPPSSDRAKDRDDENENDNDDLPRHHLSRNNVTIKSVILHNLPTPDFRNYLLSDGIQLPKEASELSSCATANVVNGEADSDDDDDWSKKDDDDSTSQDQANEFSFPQLTAEISDAIRTLKGSVVPKLNWSAPKDATWVNEGTLKCQTPGDVYLLLKSSDFCMHDVLEQGLQHCRDYQEHSDDDDDEQHQKKELHLPLQLVLRKWCNLHPSMEFRCFVRRHELIAISQRNHSQHYPHLMKDWTNIREVLDDFFEDVIRLRFADGKVSSYVVDVYLDQKNRVWIVDFNPWSRTTDSLLFDWSTELMTMDGRDVEGGEPPVMRVVETAQQVRQDPLSSYRAPIDAVELASMTHGDSKEFEKFMKQCQHQTDEGHDTEEQ